MAEREIHPLTRLAAIVGGEGSGLDIAGTLESLRGSGEPEIEIVLVVPDTEPRVRTLWESACSRWRARLVTGGGDWRDAGFRDTDAALLVPIEAGMRLEPGYLSRATSLLRGDPELAFVASWARLEMTHDVERVELMPVLEAAALGARPDATPRAAVLRRSLWEALAGFGGAPPGLEEWVFWLSATGRGHSGMVIEEPLVALPGRLGLPPEVPSNEALDAVWERLREVLAADPARLLEAQELAIRRLVPRHERQLAHRARVVAELEELREEEERLRDELHATGDDEVDWGDLGRPVPLSRDWGFDRGGRGRGVPVDRHYIERFLESCAGDVRGVVLEVQGSDYTRRFGGDRVERCDVIDVDPENHAAGILADLTGPSGLALSSYDCFILTQTLHVLPDMRAAVGEAYRTLKPGGVLLATLPCASRVCLEYGADGDFWRVTEAGARRLFGQVFPHGCVETRSWGNALSSAAFLYGAAADEVGEEALDAFDPYLPLLVSVRAVKPGGARPGRAPAALGRRRRARLPPRPKGALIALYHRVAEPARDAHSLAVSPDDFAEQMEALSEDWDPVALDELARAVVAGRSLDGLAAVTLDDGYADALYEASPILSAVRIPATFFVATGALEDPSVLWWDQLERVLLSGAPLPTVLEIELERARRRFPTARAAERRSAHDALHSALVVASERERSAILEHLLRWSDAERQPPLRERPLTSEQLLRLAGRAGHSVGAHSRLHLVASHQPRDVVAREVIGAREDLVALLGEAPTAYAYPRGDVTPEAVSAVRESGFACAVTCEERLVQRGDDPLRLPRIVIGAGGRDRFRARLRELPGQTSRA